MPYIDHHKKPYDEGTLNKLDIFERYIEAWLPTFIMQSHIKEINIVDFFSGLGYDSNGIAGSPIRTLEKINTFLGWLIQNRTKINLFLNEFDKKKFDVLKINCNNFLEKNKQLNEFVEIHYSNQDFNQIYNEIIIKTKNKPNLYIIDQNGIKFTNKDNFNTLLNLDTTDFLFFISSSFFKRFSGEDEFNKHLDISEEDLQSNPYNFIHRIVLDKYRSLIPEGSKQQIFPFSIKKGANIYGIIFGSKHFVGVEKFLKIAWDTNKLNGEANFDIDNDFEKSQPSLFPEMKQLTKIEGFEHQLEDFLKKNKIVTNEQLYYFTYKNGHIVEHTNNHLRKLRNKKIIDFTGHPKISWKKIKEKDIVNFRWL